MKNKKFIVPLEDGKFWIGSTNEWDIQDEHSNPDKQRELESYLDSHLNREYSVLQKWTGVRPATKRRRPIIGRHPDWTNVYLFNGFGTKGVSLAPYWSEQLVALMIENKNLDKEVDISGVW